METNNPLYSVRQFFSGKSSLSVLILLNIIVFILVNVFQLGLWLFQISAKFPGSDLGMMTWWLGLPAYLPSLVIKPWTIITYMFVQEEFLHILFNMIVLYFGGQLFTSFFNEKKLVSTYLLGGISGGILYILSFNIFPVFSSSLPFAIAIGASASVLAVLVAVATYSPDTEIQLILFGRIRLKYIALIFVVLDLLSIRQGNPGGHIAHLGGALWGFCYIRFFLNRYNWFKKLPDGWNLFSFMNRRRKKFRYTYVNQKPPVDDDEYNKIKVEKQKRMDEILDKISKSGYDRLTKEEKEFLFNSRRK